MESVAVDVAVKVGVEETVSLLERLGDRDSEVDLVGVMVLL